MQVSPAVVLAVIVAAWEINPAGDINGTTQFREEAGAVSDPPGLIHLSAQQIGVFPVYPPHHILHPARLLHLSSISEAALIPYLGE